MRSKKPWRQTENIPMNNKQFDTFYELYWVVITDRIRLINVCSIVLHVTQKSVESFRLMTALMLLCKGLKRFSNIRSQTTESSSLFMWTQMLLLLLLKKSGKTERNTNHCCAPFACIEFSCKSRDVRNWLELDWLTGIVCVLKGKTHL